MFLGFFSDLEYPCVGHLLALRGTDGSVIWKAPVKLELIFINCEEFDVNLDGQKDCIVTGRQSTLQAIDSKTGLFFFCTFFLSSHVM